MHLVTILGLLAGSLTTLSFAPQAIKAWRTEKTRDISLSFTLILLVGVLLWFIYGVGIGAIPVILANGVSAVLIFLILVAKLKYEGFVER